VADPRDGADAEESFGPTLARGGGGALAAQALGLAASVGLQGAGCTRVARRGRAG